MGRRYTSVGQMAPFYVFPCGHSFHTQCLVAHVTRCTVETHVSIQIVSIFTRHLFMTICRVLLSESLLFPAVPSIFFIRINEWHHSK
jgi:hypothetical protein